MGMKTAIIPPALADVQRIINAALAEDVGTGDITGNLLIPEGAVARMAFVNREMLVVCGLNIAADVFRAVESGVRCDIRCSDGEIIDDSSILMQVEGPARALLAAERTALNLLQRMSAVATQTRRFVKLVEGTGAVILDTRKTMPGLRVLDKYAVRAGGGKNHRMRLDDAILIKDNHIALCGGVGEAVYRARAGSDLAVEVECDTLDQVRAAVQAGADRILLDNMPVATLREAVQMVGHAVPLEASGNVTLETVREIAETGVDFISIGRLTHSVPSVDIGLDVLYS